MRPGQECKRFERRRRLCASALLLAMLGGCRMVSTRSDELAAAREHPAFDARAFVARDWTCVIAPSLDRSAAPADLVTALLRREPQAAASRYGRKSEDGGQWTFVVTGEGRIAAIDRRSRAGSITVALADGSTLRIQTGPVIAGTALRDALPFIRFNDFPNQIAFAEVNSALIARAEPAVQAGPAALRIGDRVHFAGAFPWNPAAGEILLTPYRLEKRGAAA